MAKVVMGYEDLMCIQVVHALQVHVRRITHEASLPCFPQLCTLHN